MSGLRSIRRHLYQSKNLNWPLPLGLNDSENDKRILNVFVPPLTYLEDLSVLSVCFLFPL